MAKIYGLFGSMTGKVADVVMSVRYGEQIARKYQPIVSNPSTAAQVAQRAKLKLMSQMSAVMAPVIAIPRQGTKTSRNLFTKKNIKLVGYSSDTATVQLDSVQLTSSAVGLVPVTAARDANVITASMSTNTGLDVDRIVYAVFEKGANDSLRFLGSAVVSEPGTNNSYTAEFPLTQNSVVVLAYGVRDNSDTARAVFGDLVAPTAETVAELVVTRTLREDDVTLTETRGTTLAAAN